MNKFLLLASLLLTVCTLFLLSCEKDEKVKPPVEDLRPDLEIVSAEVHEDGGVTLTGRVNKNHENFAGLGFSVASDSLFKNQIITPPPIPNPALGDFKVEISGSLEKGKRYYFRIFTIDVNWSYKTYEVKSFMSYGSKKVEFKSISPLKAALGDTINLTGKYLYANAIDIKFDDIRADLISVNDSLLKIIIPLNLRRINPIITNYGVDTLTISTAFSLFTPVLTDYTPVATFRDTVSIRGDHFSVREGGTEVWFGNVRAPIVFNSRELLKVIVPDDIEKMETVLSVKSQLQTVMATSKFQIKKPELTAVPSSGFALTEITVTGKNFHPYIPNNKITFENTEANVISGNTTQMKLYVPSGPFARRKASIKLKLLDYQVSYPVDITIKDKWVVVSNPIPFDDYQPIGAFTINNMSFVIANQKGTDQSYLWKFNPAKFTWDRVNMPFNARTGVVSCNSEKAYVYLTRDANNFWEYNPVGNKWTKKKDYPGKTRSQPTTFTIENRVYLGTGYHEDYGSHADNTFYQYNVNTDTWKRVADYPSESEFSFRIGAAAFVLNKIAYVGCGDSSGAKSNFYRYDEINDKWIAIKDFRNAGLYVHSFSYNNFCYICGGGTRDCYRYDPVRDTWTRLKDPIGPEQTSPGIERSFAFVNNGFVYSGSGGSGSQGIGLLQARIDEL